MPLAKSIDTNTPVNATPTIPPTPNMQFDGLPIDFYRVFSVDLGTVAPKEIEKLKAIYEWSKEGTETVGDMMQKVSRLESELGAPALNEKRYDKLFRFVKMQKAINELRKQQDSLSARRF